MSDDELKKEYVFGIDLGTTYSCISYMDEDGRPVVCKSIDNEDTFPSVVRYLPDEEPVAGRTAKDTAVMYPEYTISYIKNFIGKVSEYEYGAEGDKRTVTPEEVSAEILKKVAADAAANTNTTVHKVVITVPAYFGDPEKKATMEAGKLAGLEVIDIVEEPTAAAFYYGTQKFEGEETICIYDLGGGTFDVTVMKVSDHKLEEITKAGDHNLGGKRWDDELINLVKRKFCEATDYDEEFESDVLQDMYIRCEVAKKQLSSTEKTSVAVKTDRVHKANIEITREEFDAVTSFLLQESIDITKSVFKIVADRGINIDKILLVGGSSYMPQVKKAIQEEFGMEPLMNEPNEAVAKGACIYCAWKYANDVVKQQEDPKNTDAPKPEIIETGDGKTVINTLDGTEIVLPGLDGDYEIVRVASKSYGIRANVAGKPMIVNLLIKDTKMESDGIHFSQTFGTNADNMTNVSIKLFQNESLKSECELDEGVLIGEAVLSGIPAGMPRHTPVDIFIDMQENGMISVKGKYNGEWLSGELISEKGETSEA